MKLTPYIITSEDYEWGIDDGVAYSGPQGEVVIRLGNTDTFMTSQGKLEINDWDITIMPVPKDLEEQVCALIVRAEKQSSVKKLLMKQSKKKSIELFSKELQLT